MSAYVYTYMPGLINAEQFVSLLHEMQLLYAYVECEAEIALVRTDDLLNGVQPSFRPANLRSTNPVIPFNDWTHGRVFGESAELRWDKNGELYRLLLLTEEAVSSVWMPQHDNFDPSYQDRYVMLLGTRTVDLDAGHALHGTSRTVRIETRYPRPLVYPVADDVKQVYLHCRDYSVRSVVVLTRLVGVQG